MMLMSHNHCDCCDTGVVDTAGAAVGGIDGGGQPIDLSPYAKIVDVNQQFADLIAGAPPQMNTLRELAEAILAVEADAVVDTDYVQQYENAKQD